MAEYKEIHGTKIRNYTTNPDNPITGEVWYNDTDNVLKFQFPTVTTVGSWRTDGNMNTARRQLIGTGLYTAALAFGGRGTPPPTRYTNTESYDGTSWTEVNDLNTARSDGSGMGVSTSTIAAGGITPSAATNVTDTWNGTHWTEVTDLNAARYGIRGFGSTNTAAVAFRGAAP